MLGSYYELYDKALAFLGREALEFRRVHLCQTICNKDHPKQLLNWYKDDTDILGVFFLNGQSAIITVITVIKIKGHQNRTRFKFHLVHTRTGRYEELLILYMTKILNSNLTHYSMWIVDYNWWRLLLSMSSVSNCI